MTKTSFTAKLEIPGLAEHRVMAFEVVGDKYFFKLCPLYLEGEEQIPQLKDIYFNVSWMARNPKNQKVVDWIKSVFKEKGLLLN